LVFLFLHNYFFTNNYNTQSYYLVTLSKHKTLAAFWIHHPSHKNDDMLDFDIEKKWMIRNKQFGQLTGKGRRVRNPICKKPYNKLSTTVNSLRIKSSLSTPCSSTSRKTSWMISSIQTPSLLRPTIPLKSARSGLNADTTPIYNTLKHVEVTSPTHLPFEEHP
jgi:hypothetical protein